MSDRIHIAAPDVGARASSRIMQVLMEGRLAEGEEVTEFESAFADYLGAAHAVATANGTAALHAALEGLDVGPGDRVVTTPFSFVATANAIRIAGADPVFADVRADTYNVDPDELARIAEEEDVDAVLPVHLYGHPAEMDRIERIADRHDLDVIEDAAQAHGATYDGTPVGSIGDAGCFSFYPTKNMTTGEGGMVVTNDPGVRESVRSYVDHGRTGTYEHAEVGHNYRMTNVAAAIGLEQVSRLEGFVHDRRENAALLSELLEDGPADVTTPTERPHVKHAYHQFTVRHRDRAGLAAHLDDAGIGTGVYYPHAIHEQPAYDDVEADCPVAERVADEVLSLPVHPGLDGAAIRRIAREVNAYDRTQVRA
jgi:dTDP-4-amino-4,6-dideoxygalactose transaminase